MPSFAEKEGLFVCFRRIPVVGFPSGSTLAKQNSMFVSMA